MRVKFGYRRKWDDASSYVNGEGTIAYWYTMPIQVQVGYDFKDSAEPRAVLVDDKGNFHDVGIGYMSQILEQA